MLNAIRDLVRPPAHIDVRAIATGVVVGLLTFLVAQLGYTLSPYREDLAPCWPASGIAVGAMLASTGPTRMTSLVGALAGILLFEIRAGHGAAWTASGLVGHAVEFILIERAVSIGFGHPFRLDTLRNTVGLMVIAALGSAIAAVPVALGLHFLANADASVPTIWLTWTASHAVGVGVVAPVFIVLAGELADARKLDASDAEGALMLGLTTIAAVGVLGSNWLSGPGTVIGFSRIAPFPTFFPLLLWAGARCRPSCVAVASIVVSLFTLLGLANGVGAFVDAPDGVRHIATAQIFMFSVAFCALVLSSLTQQRRKVEEDLREALQHNRLALSAGDIGTWSYSPDTGQIDGDANARAIWGIGWNNAISGSDLETSLHPDDRQRYRASLASALDPAGSGHLMLEYRLQATSERDERWAVATAQTEFEGGRAKRLVGTIRDITDRQRAAQFLARDNQTLEALVSDRTQQLEAILESAVAAIITINSEGIIQSINHATSRLFGHQRADMIGRNVNMLMPQPDSVRHDGYLEHYLTTGEKKIIGIGREVLALRRDGTTFPIHLSVSEFKAGGARCFAGIITDLTHEKAVQANLRETERQLLQAQKMEAIGQLSGGIAHDFNNLLTVISGNLELLDMRLEKEQDRDLLRRAVEATRRGARLTERLSTMSRRRALQPVSLDLNTTVIGMTELMRRALGENVSVSTDLTPGLWKAHVDSSEIENAILNLAINARDAMPDGGRIIIETGNTVLSARDIAGNSDTKPGEFVRLSLIDGGCGMPPDVLARALEPFFTTKPPGRGTGLGLSTIYGFVRQSGGHLTIDSAPGKGTTVSLFLPRDQSATETPERQDASIPADPPKPATILVVEDNQDVRLFAVDLLKALGHRTVTAANGPSAVAIMEADHGIDLVFSDVVMPGGMSGFDLARWLKQHRPQIPILLASGFAPQDDPGYEPAVDAVILKKPYSRSDLNSAICDILNRMQRQDA
ncbi:MAG: PAS domain S-box protein [Hyphomicrobiaceae bacterium]